MQHKSYQFGFAHNTQIISVTNQLRIDIISHNISKNNFGRAVLLAEIIQRFANVKVIGVCKANTEIWPPQAQTKINLVKIEAKHKSKFSIIKEIEKNCSGNIVIACKPHFYSLFAGIYIKFKKKIPLITDIDDWERGFLLDSISQSSLKNKFYYIIRYLTAIFFEQALRFSNDILVSNSQLQKKFGGNLVPHYKDTNNIKPIPADMRTKHKLGIPKDRQIILFLGTDRPHKGLPVLQKAFKALESNNSILLILGLDKSDTRISDKKQNVYLRSEGIYYFGFQPANQLANILSISDIIVIPQLSTHASECQLPAKLIDAMSSGKAIISTSVSDIPAILSENCGLVSKPGDFQVLSENISTLLDNKDIRKELGLNARMKAVQHYSFETGEDTLKKIFKKVLEN